MTAALWAVTCGDVGTSAPEVFPNGSPVAIGTIPAQRVLAGETVSLDVSGYFSDPDRDALTYAATTSSPGVASPTMSGARLTVAGVSAGTATISVTVRDPWGLTATQSTTVTVERPNRSPVAVGTIAPLTVLAGETATLSLSGYFSDPDGDSFSYSVSTSDPGVASPTVSGSTLTIAGVAPGTAMVTVTASDPGGLTASQSFGVTVEPANQTPVTVGRIPAQTVTVGNDVSVEASGYFRDPDGDNLTYAVASSDARVARVVLSGVTVTVTGLSTGTATVTVTASDPGGRTATQSFGVTVRANRGPVAVGSIPAQTVAPGSSVTVAVSGYFRDPDGDNLTYAAGSSNTGVAWVSAVSGDTVTVTGVTAGTAFVTVEAADPGGRSALQSFGVTVQRANRAPVAVGSIPAQTVATGSAVTVEVSGYFGDSDGDVLTYVAGSSNAGVARVAVSGDTLTVTGVSAGTATVTVTAGDPGGLTASQSFRVTVQRTNQAPVAVGSIPAQTVGPGAATTVVASAYFGDPDGDVLTYVAASSDAGVARVAVSGDTVTVTGVSAGTATVTVAAGDPGGLTALQAFQVTVQQTNQAPVAVGSIPAQTVAAGSTLTVKVSGYFEDPDGDVLTYVVSSSNTAVARVTVSGDTVTVTGVAAGTATVTVAAGDPGGRTATQSFEVTVQRVNQAPVAVGSIPAQTVAAGSAVTVKVSGYFEDPDGDVLTYVVSSSNTAVARVTVSGDTVTVTGVAAGTATVTVAASDPGGSTATQAMDINVTTSAVPANVCQRTVQVRDEIVRVTRKANCADVTAADLAGIESLNLSSDSITALQEGDFAGLSSLQSLSLYANALATLPEGVFDGLASLQSVSLRRNDLATLPEGLFRGLSSLRILNLGLNDLATLREGLFAGLSSLQNLDLELNDVATLPEDLFAGLSSLEKLVLAWNDLSTLPEGVFAGLTNLQHLHLGYNDLASLPEGVFTELSSLRELRLAANDLASLPADVFAGLTSLQVLDLGTQDPLVFGQNQLDTLPEGLFAGLSSLRVLGLENIDLDTLPEGLFAGLSSLELLYLHQNNLATLPERLFAGLSRLQLLQLRQNNLAILPEGLFAGLSGLQSLLLEQNNLAALPTGVFAGLSSLERLFLTDNPGTPFRLTVELQRTDSGNLAAPSPATVAIAVAEGAPFAMSVPLSVTGGELASEAAVLATGAQVSSPVGVTRSAGTTGNTSIAVGVLPEIPSSIEGIMLEAGESLVLFASTPPLSIVTESLARARATLPYTARLEATGGSEMDYTWRLGQGSSLPAGLVLESAGTIRGVPANAGTVAFEARVVDSEGNEASRTLTLNVCKGPVGLALGEVHVMEPGTITGCGFYLRAPEAGAYYRVTFSEIDADAESVYDVGLTVEGSSPSQPMPIVAARTQATRRFMWQQVMSEAAWAVEQEAERANAAFHARLRAQEAELMRRLAAEGNLDILPDRSRQEAEIGSDQRRGRAAPAEQDFRLSAPGEVSSCQVHETVTARLIAENEHFIVYEYATSAPLQHVTRTIDFYSDHGAEVIERYFGGVSDVNGDGTVTILIRPELEGRTAYVWSADMTLTQEQCAASNEMELMHVEVEAFEDFDENRYWALAGVVHEMVHVSSLYKRVRGHVRRGGTGERFHPTWIEEGRAEIGKEAASRLAWERLGGPAFTARIKGEMINDALRAGGTRRAAVWGTFGTMARVVRAFSPMPNAITFEPLEDEGTVYGSGWHFHRFLRDWIGKGGTSRTEDEALIRELNDSLTAPGVAGIVAVMGRPIEVLLEEHATAMTIAGDENLVTGDVPRFATYDFPSSTEIFRNPDPPGLYPWPVTTVGEDSQTRLASIAVPLGVPGTRTFEGRLASSGVRVHDFRARAKDEAATFHVDVPGSVRVIVARIRDPNP